VYNSSLDLPLFTYYLHTHYAYPTSYLFSVLRHPTPSSTSAPALFVATASMAANDYYNSQQQPHGSSTHYPKSDSPISPPSAQNPYSSSPFDDYHTPNSSGALGGYPSHSTTNTSYHGAQQDPFTDHNAIPLHAQPKMDGHGHGHGHKLDDGSPMRYDTDPEGGVRRKKSKRKMKKKKGWLNGRVTWVVYILTTVQIAVFVGELIKNGESFPSQYPPPYLHARKKDCKTDICTQAF
jgi:hypothetical protein